jgi:triacylglycerol lipase
MMKPALRDCLLVLLAVSALPACLMGEEWEGSGQPRDIGLPPTKPPATGAPRVGFLLAHGLGGSVDSYDPAIVEALRADGFYVLRDAVPPVDSVAVRAAALAKQVDTFIAANQLTKLHLIGHSMGGLDARYLISTLKYAPKIKSLTTLQTPHRGSPIADIALGITDSVPATVEEAILALTGVLGEGVTAEQLERALVDLAEANAPAFNAANPDASGVTYYSYAGLSTLFGVGNPNAEGACGGAGVTAPVPSPSSLPGVLKLTGPIVAGGTDLRPHDGVVPVDSARWTGFLGCLPTDHLDMTRAGEKPAAELMIDLVAFYRQAAARVAGL